MSGILNIGKSALAAAQVGITTTGHNIANASTPGYSRQVVVQAAAQSQNFGYGYVGQGAEIAGVTRIYNEILAAQMVRSQSTSTSVETYSKQLSSINNMLSDPTAGLNPAMNEFFGAVQDLSANPSDIPTRQTMLSYAQSLASRFQSTSDRLTQIQEGVNTQITTGVGMVNMYARQIAGLNDVIEKAVNATGSQPNDLLDQRDQLVNELSKQVKTTVIPQGQGSYNVYIGNGMPLVVGNETFQLIPSVSPTDPTRVEVAYATQGKVTVLGSNSITGGTLGGLLQFREESLDVVQNQVGQLAAVMAESFNAQLKVGYDKNGALGSALFSIPDPSVNAHTDNSSPTTTPANATPAIITSKIVDARAITTSDYRLEYDGTNYNIKRLSDGVTQSFSDLNTPRVVDGVSFSLASGTTMLSGDNFVIKPTQQAATLMKVAISDPSKLAVGGPAVTSSANPANTGGASISAPVATSTFSSVPAAYNITFNHVLPAPPSFTASQAVSVTYNGVTTDYTAGQQVVVHSGATLTTGGLKLTITGTPAVGDVFTISPNAAGGPSDNRNGLLLAALQSEKTVNGNKSSMSDAFGQMVNSVGNKTRELNILSQAEAQVLEQTTAAMQAESGVNLDEEAVNLIRYQQAYQAAGKMMQIASQLFDVLLSIGQ